MTTLAHTLTDSATMIRRNLKHAVRYPVLMGLAARSVESASNLPMPLILLPFLGSGFVPTESLPTGLTWFAEYQPFTPIIETLRGLLTGTAIGGSAVLAAAWCAALALTGHLWSRARYDRRPAR